MTSIKSLTTAELQKIRQDLIECAENDSNVFGLDISRIHLIDAEIEYRAKKRTLADDEQPENPILDRGLSFAPKNSY